ncbi:MAG: MerR family transcriptional regulator [Candidatus Omnitrophica bacterium]|nr:MerR family transcriptional regulator [Candidatus Omnitrophota bacterium]
MRRSVLGVINNEEFKLDSDEPIFPTGVVCRLLGIPVWVLKQLDREKIVSPPRKGHCARLYSINEMKKLKHIWFLMKRRKVKIDGIKVILEMESKMKQA